MCALSPLHSLKLELFVGNARLVVKVSPCSFMYPGYGLQLSVTLNDGQQSIISNRQPMTNVTATDVQALFDKVKVHKCVQCDAPAFDRATISTNAEGMCWECINVLIETEFAAENACEVEKMDRELNARKADAKVLGQTHLVTAVIHPAHGDDYCEYFFTQSDSPAQIKAVLLKTGCQVTTDYRVEKL